MEWTNRKNLDKATIETILKGSKDFKRLVKAYPSDEVPYPVMKACPSDEVPYPVIGVDVVDALTYIVEENLVGSFFDSLQNCKGEGLIVKHIKYEIPINDRTPWGRVTPNISFCLRLNGKGKVEGRLYHTFEGEHTIIDFLETPKDNAPAKV